jgi:hypothetical protein
MKKIFTILTFFMSIDASAQTSDTTKFDGVNWVAPYTLSFPKGWDYERFLIPMEFAPQIPYKGIEDIRFTPGWGNAKTDEYWTYAFLWYLDHAQKTNAKILEHNLNAYYTGLVGRNIEKRKISADKLVPVKTEIKQLKIDHGDLKTFGGTIYMLDYMEQKPITLNCIIHVKNCNERKKTFIFYEISPRPLTDDVWKKLDQLWTKFNCLENTDVQ